MGLPAWNEPGTSFSGWNWSGSSHLKWPRYQFLKCLLQIVSVQFIYFARFAVPRLDIFSRPAVQPWTVYWRPKIDRLHPFFRFLFVTVHLADPFFDSCSISNLFIWKLRKAATMPILCMYIYYRGMCTYMFAIHRFLNQHIREYFSKFSNLYRWSYIAKQFLETSDMFLPWRSDHALSPGPRG